MSAFWSMARDSASFMRQPPDKVVTGSVIIFLLKPTFSIIWETSSFVEPQAWMRLRAEDVLVIMKTASKRTQDQNGSLKM
jgi:hypothetical protein